MIIPISAARIVPSQLSTPLAYAAPPSPQLMSSVTSTSRVSGACMGPAVQTLYIRFS